MKIIKYTQDYFNLWDNFVISIPRHTFQHTRNFLSYHGERFHDQSILVFDDKDKLVAVFPAANSPNDENVVVSHPGASFGGILTRSIKGEAIISLINEIANYYRDIGKKKLIYKAIPHFYHSQPFQDDLYALFRLGADHFRVDLSATIHLDDVGKISERRKRGIKKATKAGVQIISGLDCAQEIWEVLEENLLRKHNVKPTHNLNEILLLAKRFPDEITFHAAYLENHCIAGIVLFSSKRVDHAQYISSSSEGYKVSALDLLFSSLIDNAKRNEKKYFDFGISNEKAGMILNESLYKFKTEFGAGGTVHDFFELELGIIEE